MVLLQNGSYSTVKEEVMMESRKPLRKAIIVMAAVALVFGFQMPSMALAGSPLKIPKLTDPNYLIQALKPKTEVNGFNGLAFDSQGTLYAGVVQGSTTYKVDKESGAVTPYILPPEGGADDLVFEPGGRVIWTALFLGKVFARGADGKITTLAENLPGANAIARSTDGRVFWSMWVPGNYFASIRRAVRYLPLFRTWRWNSSFRKGSCRPLP
jgi:hypothetical protein